MSIEEKIENLSELSAYINNHSEELQAIKVKAMQDNPWFTLENIDFALESIANQMLDRESLENWLKDYSFGEEVKSIGLILAGNIPLVGFHDLICTYLSGHHAIIKTSSKDDVLTVHLLSKLRGENWYTLVDRLTGMDAIIATGSNQSAKQFDYYFKDYPRIIRRNRNAIAILDNSIDEKGIELLGKDIFTYFGLGCRNVSKIYIPSDFDRIFLMEVLHDRYKHLITYNKYKNNYDYNNAIFLLNGDEYLASGAVLLRKSEDIVSRIACLHYEEYEDLEKLENELLNRIDEIQCISGTVSSERLTILPLGSCQKPKINDYADGIDTMKFLENLSRV